MGRLVTVLSLNWTSGSGEQPTNVTSLFLRNTYKGLGLFGAGPYIRQKGLPPDQIEALGEHYLKNITIENVIFAFSTISQ